MEFLGLGGCADIGRSCMYLRINQPTWCRPKVGVLFDCGMHHHYEDHRRLPDFRELGQPLNECVDAVLLTHLHLDHVGGLPHLCQEYQGLVLASRPTQAILPVTLMDAQKISARAGNPLYTPEAVGHACQMVQGVNPKECTQIQFCACCPPLRITFYYAGHVLGACSIFVEYGELNALYTGDFNANADGHLHKIEVPRLCPRVVITETTYCNSVKENRRRREMALMQKIWKRLDNQGNVLIPVFAMGRAHELCLLLDHYWEAFAIGYPIYFSAHSTQTTFSTFEMFGTYTQDREATSGSIFQFKHLKMLPPMAAIEEPCIIIASPGMMHEGTSLRVFEKWAPDKKNLVLIPGFCSPHTVGGQALNGSKQISCRVDGRDRMIHVGCPVQSVSFSAHADAIGIIHLMEHLRPQNVVLVHGNLEKMQVFQRFLSQHLEVPVFLPQNGEPLNFPPPSDRLDNPAACAWDRDPDVPPE